MMNSLASAAGRLSTWMKVVLVGWTALLTGCDERPRWRTIGSDTGRETGTTNRPDAPRGRSADGVP